MVGRSTLPQLDFLKLRRSAKAKHLIDPGPSDEVLKEILQAAMRVPDHGMLTPWRLVVVERQNRQAFGTLLRECYETDIAEPKLGRAEALARFALEAPCLVILLSLPDQKSRIPVWEQQLSAGAAGMMFLTAAHAAGFAGVWLTGPAAYCVSLPQKLGYPTAKVAGFMLMGTPASPTDERARPDYAKIVSCWRPATSELL